MVRSNSISAALLTYDPEQNRNTDIAIIHILSPAKTHFRPCRFTRAAQTPALFSIELAPKPLATTTTQRAGTAYL